MEDFQQDTSTYKQLKDEWQIFNTSIHIKVKFKTDNRNSEITWRFLHTSRIAFAYISTHTVLKYKSQSDTNIIEVKNETHRIITMNLFNAFFTYNATSTIPTEMIINHLNRYPICYQKSSKFSRQFIQAWY